jgi:hypothetical protein
VLLGEFLGEPWSGARGGAGSDATFFMEDIEDLSLCMTLGLDPQLP